MLPSIPAPFINPGLGRGGTKHAFAENLYRGQIFVKVRRESGGAARDQTGGVEGKGQMISARHGTGKVRWCGRGFIRWSLWGDAGGSGWKATSGVAF